MGHRRTRRQPNRQRTSRCTPSALPTSPAQGTAPRPGRRRAACRPLGLILPLPLRLRGPQPTDWQSAAASDAGARDVTPTRAMRPRAHMPAWQPRRGARHNAAFREPAGPGAARGCATKRSAAQRSDWRNFAECRVMLNAAGIHPIAAVPLLAVDLADGEARVQARNERAPLP